MDDKVAATWNTGGAVVVCGVHNNEITDDGSGVQRFASLGAAQEVFPDLDPRHDTERFTGAMDSRHVREMRFETHQANKFYSARFAHRVPPRFTPHVSHNRWSEPKPAAHD